MQCAVLGSTPTARHESIDGFNSSGLSCLVDG